MKNTLAFAIKSAEEFSNVSAANHAERILDAWDSKHGLLEAELESALRSCRIVAPLSTLELEQQEVLESVVEHLRSHDATQQDFLPKTLQAGYSLLRHLSSRAVA